MQWVWFGGEQVKKSHHSLINPAITITLRSGSGGQGVPPLVSVDGKQLHPGLLVRTILIKVILACCFFLKGLLWKKSNFK